MKTHITISIDVEVAAACKNKPNGFTSKACNDALREALSIPISDVEKARRKKNNPDRIFVRGVGWIGKEDKL